MIPKSQNYRTVRRGGQDLYLIRVDGTDVPVSREIYRAYAQMERHARYQEQLAQRLETDLTEAIPESVPSAEELLMEQELDKERNARLTAAIESLNLQEYELYDALFVRQLTARQYARVLGVHHSSVERRRKLLLRKLRKQFFPETVRHLADFLYK